MPTQNSRPVQVAERVNRFSYAIRNIVAEAKAVEARGQRVRYLNIGDPVAFGFRTPEHLVDAVVKAMRDGQNGYLPSAGILPARQAVADDYAARGVQVSPDRVLITGGTSEAIDIALNALVDEGDEVLVPLPTYPLYTAVLGKIGAHPRYYRCDPARDWQPDLEHLRANITPRTRVLVVIDPNNPTGAIYPPAVRRALIELAERHDLTIVADEVYGDLCFDGPVPLLGSLNQDAPIISMSSLSKAYLAPGWRAGWLVIGKSPRLDDALTAMKKLSDARLCSPGPMQFAVAAALTGDRSHQPAFRAALAERAAVTTELLNSIPGMRCVQPRGAFYAMPQLSLPPGRTDEDFVLALLRETGILCVHGSGFGMPPEAGSFRIVFLADPKDLREIYADISSFTAQYVCDTPDVPVTRQDNPRALIRYALAGLALTVALTWMLFLVRDAILLIYVSALIAIGLSPLVNAIERFRSKRQRVPRWAAILVIYLALIGTLVVVGLLIVPPLIDQAQALWTALPDLLHRAQLWLIQRGLIGRELSVREAVQQSPVGGSDAVSTVFTAVWGVAGGLFGVVTILILTFYMLVEGQNIVNAFLRLFPRAERARVQDACHRVTTKVSAWLAGQLLLALIIGATAALGLWLLGVPYFYVLALIAGIGEIIPVVGPIISAIPALAVALTVSPTLAFGVLVFFFLQQQFENHVLVPKVMERQVGVSAMIVIIALLIGGSLLGIVGAILAVPTAAILQVLYEEMMGDAPGD